MNTTRHLSVLWLGLVACAPTGSADTAPLDAPTDGVWRVLTYNVAGLPDALSNPASPLLDRMPQIRDRLAGYDLVGLQENFDAAGHAALTEGTGHAEVMWFDAPLDGTRFYGSGLAQLLPMTATLYEETYFSTCHGVLDGASDCLASKGFQASVLMAGGQPITVFNTHHEAGGGDEDQAARLQQVEELLAAVANVPNDHAVVVLGDFNLRPSDPTDTDALARYDEAGLPRSCDLIGCAEADHIDQVRVRSSATLTLEVLDWRNEPDFVDAKGRDLSDHPAIAVDLGWQVVGAE